jgi:WD40 repeat protein
MVLMSHHPSLSTAATLLLIFATGCGQSPPAGPEAGNRESSRSSPQLSVNHQQPSVVRSKGDAPSPDEPVAIIGWPTSLAYSPDGALLVAGNDTHLPTLVDTKTHEKRSPWKGDDGESYSAVFSHDGKRVVAGVQVKDGNPVHLWDAHTGSLLKAFPGHTGRILSVAITPDGKTIASGGKDNLLKVWDVETGKEKYTKDQHKTLVASVTFSPDGKLLASGGDDAVVRLWETDSGKEVKNLKVDLPDETSQEVRALAFSPDGNLLAVTGFSKAVQLWDVKTGEKKHLLKGIPSWTRAVAFSSDGSTLASGGDDMVIRLWDVKTGTLSRSLSGHRRAITALAFPPVKGRLASASNDSTIRFWDVEKAIVRKP